jgi:hypothetical protein
MPNTKGTALIQCVKALKAFPGSAGTLPPRLHHYLNERIVVSSWYPEADYLALITAMTKVIPSGGGDNWTRFGTMAAQHDLTTVYRSMVRQGTLLAMLKALRDLFRIYHDTGRIVISGDEKLAQLDLYDYASISAGHCRFITAYMAEHLRMSLGEAIPVKELSCCAAGAAFCRREFSRATAPRPPR